MPLVSASELERVKNFSKAEAKCMNCQKLFTSGRGVYERRFCSDTCRLDYFG